MMIMMGVAVVAVVVVVVAAVVAVEAAAAAAAAEAAVAAVVVVVVVVEAAAAAAVTATVPNPHNGTLLTPKNSAPIEQVIEDTHTFIFHPTFSNEGLGLLERRLVYQCLRSLQVG